MLLFQHYVAAQVSGYGSLPEKEPLLEVEADPPPAYEKRDVAPYVPIPRRMRWFDIPRVVKATRKALSDDPLERYLYVAPEENKRLRKVKIIEYGLGFSIHVRHKKGWIVDGGDAFMCYSDPRISRSKLSKLIDKWTMSILQLEGRFFNEEQKNRLKELQTKLRKAIANAVGERKGSMLYLDHIGTVPEKQGRGYGTALARILTTKADIENHPAWLVSSNVEVNTGFYNNLGFYTVAEFVVGDDNPTWEGPPVMIAVMVREPRR